MVCDGSRHCSESVRYNVLILILLEYGLRQTASLIAELSASSLNPYSIGIWSATHPKKNVNILKLLVLILILLEYGLRLCDTNATEISNYVLILILLEYGLRHDGTLAQK